MGCGGSKEVKSGKELELEAYKFQEILKSLKN